MRVSFRLGGVGRGGEKGKGKMFSHKLLVNSRLGGWGGGILSQELIGSRHGGPFYPYSVKSDQHQFSPNNIHNKIIQRKEYEIFRWSPQTRCFDLLSNSLVETKSQNTKISRWNCIWIKGLKRLEGSQAFGVFTPLRLG